MDAAASAAFSDVALAPDDSEAAGGRNAAAFVSGGPTDADNLGAAALAAPAAYGEAGEPRRNRLSDRAGCEDLL